MLNTPASIVHAWLESLKDRDVERMIALSDPEIELVGPRGTARGHQILRDWMEGVRLELQTLQTFANGEAVVVEQHATWRDPDSGEVIGEQDVASRFHVADGQVTLYARYDSIQEGLAEAGIHISQ